MGEAAPAVTEEHVKPQRHENVTKAVDREVHQDHHHTVVQPIKHKEVLHGDDKKINTHLEREAAQFKDTSTTHNTTHTTSTAPVAQGEHTHHHVHEHIQPVIQKG